MQDHPEHDLLAAFAGGNTRAFEVLVDRHQAACLRHAAFLLGGRADVEDTVQEVFMKLVMQPPAIDKDLPPDHQARVFSAWLHTVTRNACMDVMRSESRRTAREERAATPESTSGGQAVVEANDTRAAVERSLGKLPEDQREVLYLRLLAERSYQEIAELTGKKAGTVGWLISAGMRSLSRELGPLLGLQGLGQGSAREAQ